MYRFNTRKHVFASGTNPPRRAAGVNAFSKGGVRGCVQPYRSELDSPELDSPLTHLPRVTLVFLYARVVHQADVVVDVEVEQRARLPPRLGDYHVVEREVLIGRLVAEQLQRRQVEKQYAMGGAIDKCTSVCERTSPQDVLAPRNKSRCVHVSDDRSGEQRPCHKRGNAWF